MTPERRIEGEDLWVSPLGDDLLAGVASIHLEAFNGYMNARLGSGYARAFLRWFMNDPQALALVARQGNGVLAGYVVGALEPYGKRLTRSILPAAAIALAARPWLLLDRRMVRTILGRLHLLPAGRTEQREKPVLESPVASLVGIGVAPSARRVGAGSALVAAFEDEARELGARSLRLSVYEDNLAALALYERCGWRVADLPRPPGAALYYYKTLPEPVNEPS
ncbi:MAG TPA: GNAT family N-acetyltransferase [Thermoanaerobaculia bacterium]|nr:GNAT family N-acetyltransferase [Thermoanaerobaculia bacterium]